MSIDNDLNTQLNQFRNQNAQIFAATVIAINKKEKTCVIIDDLEIEYTDVRLSSAIDENKKVVIYPEIGSSVLISIINNEDNVLFVTSYNSIDSIEGEIGTTKFLINKDGFEITRNTINLFSVFNDLFKLVQDLATEVQKISVAIGTSPNVKVIEQIKESIDNKINNDLNTILK